MNKIKKFMSKLNNLFFFSNYKNKLLKYENKQTKVKDYIFKIIYIFVIFMVVFSLVFSNWIYVIIVSFICTFFMINIIILNGIKINYDYYELSQLTIYASQLSLLISYNNVYSSIDKTSELVSEPLKTDLKRVLEYIDEGYSIYDSFKEFNYKYNNKTITLFNQSLDLYDKFGSSQAGQVLQILSEDINNLKVKKDKFLRFKKEWRTQFYVVAMMCLSMPILLNLSMNEIYTDFMNYFGNYVMCGIIIINLFVIYKVENIYADLNISEGGYM